MIADMHCDTISELRNRRKKGNNENLRSNSLALDLVRMRQNSYFLQNFAAYVELNQAEDPYEDAKELVRLFDSEIEKNKDIAGRAASVHEIEKNRSEGKLSAVLTLEEGGICMGELDKLYEFYRMGARMMTFCWNYENELAYPAVRLPLSEKKQRRYLDEKESTHGLKRRGFEFLEEMERIGMIPDVSHLSDEGIRDVLAYAKKPFAASHSNARAVYHHGRNLPDELLRKLGAHGCVIGLNYFPVFLMEPESGERASEVLARHAVHMVSCAGIESVGLGSDFDGFPGTSDVNDAGRVQKLIWALHRTGFSEGEIDQITEKNVLRLYRETWKQE